MKKLSNNKKVVLGGLIVYVIAYNAGKKDATKGLINQVEKLQELHHNIGYMTAMGDVVREFKGN